MTLFGIVRLKILDLLKIFTLKCIKINSLITVFMLTESQLLTPEVLESPELKRVRFVALVAIPVIPSVVLDSDNDLMCLELRESICEGKLPTGSVRDRCVDEEAPSSRIA